MSQSSRKQGCNEALLTWLSRNRWRRRAPPRSHQVILCVMQTGWKPTPGHASQLRVGADEYRYATPSCKQPIQPHWHTQWDRRPWRLSTMLAKPGASFKYRQRSWNTFESLPLWMSLLFPLSWVPWALWHPGKYQIREQHNLGFSQRIWHLEEYGILASTNNILHSLF